MNPGGTGLLYFSSATENTRRFVERLERPALRILGGPLLAAEPFVLICPSYGDGEGRGSVPKPVIRFLNDPANRALIRGVIGAGNRNFGRLFAHGGGVVAEKCGVPLLYRFELSGTEQDVERVNKGLDVLWTRLSETA